MHFDERTDHRLGSILLLPDLLIFLFHPLHLPAAQAHAPPRHRRRGRHKVAHLKDAAHARSRGRQSRLPRAGDCGSRGSRRRTKRGLVRWHGFGFGRCRPRLL